MLSKQDWNFARKLSLKYYMINPLNENANICCFGGIFVSDQSNPTPQAVQVLLDTDDISNTGTKKVADLGMGWWCPAKSCLVIVEVMYIRGYTLLDIAKGCQAKPCQPNPIYLENKGVFIIFLFF